MVTNVAGFTQLADDVRSVINYLHENEVIPGFYLDPVFVDTCAEQQLALTNPAVMWGGVPADLIQTDTVAVEASAFMPWDGMLMDAEYQVTIAATGLDAADVTMTGIVFANCSRTRSRGRGTVPFWIRSGPGTGWTFHSTSLSGPTRPSARTR